VAIVGTTSARSGCQHLDRGADKGAPRGFDFFQFIQNRFNMEIEKESLTLSKNSQILYSARLGNYEQLSQLWKHQILNRCGIKIPGTDSQFEFLMNF
jgi:hypothetical protein